MGIIAALLLNTMYQYSSIQSFQKKRFSKDDAEHAICVPPSVSLNLSPVEKACLKTQVVR
jgi:hypothetical protein